MCTLVPNIDLNAQEMLVDGLHLWLFATVETKLLSIDHSDSNIELNAINNEGSTAFMLACVNGHKYVAKLLQEHSKFIDTNIPENSNL